jgi:hypothetical protein
MSVSIEEAGVGGDYLFADISLLYLAGSAAVKAERPAGYGIADYAADYARQKQRDYQAKALRRCPISRIKIVHCRF